jgi:hypothetical protein
MIRRPEDGDIHMQYLFGGIALKASQCFSNFLLRLDKLGFVHFAYLRKVASDINVFAFLSI